RETTEHRLLKLRLKSRGILRRRDETEREHTLSLHGCQTALDDAVRHARLSHVAEVLQDGDCAQRALFEHTGERLLLASTARQRNLPSVRSLQTDELLRQPLVRLGYGEPSSLLLVVLAATGCHGHVILVDQLRQQKTLSLVLRLCVRQESHVTQLDVLVLVPLCKLVLGELVVGTSEALLHLSGERLLPVLPVDREELRDLVRTLNDGEQRIRHECLVVGGRTCHLTHYEQRCVAKLLLVTSLDREFRTLLCGSLVDELLNQASDGLAVDVEIVFPQHTSIQETLKLKRLVDTCCGCARGSVHLRADTSSCCVHGCHVGILLQNINDKGGSACPRCPATSLGSGLTPMASGSRLFKPLSSAPSRKLCWEQAERHGWCSATELYPSRDGQWDSNPRPPLFRRSIRFLTPQHIEIRRRRGDLTGT